MSVAKTKALLQTNPVYFLDFEACSLHPQSWPIEIGIARVRDGAVESDACLIRPHDSWDETLWSRDSQAVHGVPFQTLCAEGQAPEDAAAWFAARNVGIAISDAPEFDRRWLARLLVTAPPLPDVQLLDFDSYVALTLDPDGVDRAHCHLDTTPTPHRAGPDAARLAAAWLAGTRT